MNWCGILFLVTARTRQENFWGKVPKLVGKAINLFAGSLFKKVLMTERKSPEPWRWMRVFSEEHSKTSGRKLDGNIADWDWLKKEEEQLLENSRCLGSLKEMAVSICDIPI